MRVLQIHNMHFGEGKMRVLRAFWRGQVHIMHVQTHIMHFADQNARFTNPGCQSKNCHIKIRCSDRQDPRLLSSEGTLLTLKSTRDAYFGGNWRKIGFSRALKMRVLQIHNMHFKTHNMDYFGRC